jgi:hypothetical protein
MALIDDLRTVAAHLDPSLQPSSNEVGPLLGALIAHTEHGDAVVTAAESEDGAAAVSELVAGGEDAGAGAPTSAGAGKSASGSSSSSKSEDKK